MWMIRCGCMDDVDDPMWLCGCVVGQLKKIVVTDHCQGLSRTPQACLWPPSWSALVFRHSHILSFIFFKTSFISRLYRFLVYCGRFRVSERFEFAQSPFSDGQNLIGNISETLKYENLLNPRFTCHILFAIIQLIYTASCLTDSLVWMHLDSWVISAAHQLINNYLSALIVPFGVWCHGLCVSSHGAHMWWHQWCLASQGESLGSPL